ncbi:PAS domain-containing protein [Alkalibacter rhizosphaerae]|uniref:PAS domain-containing protein n=1 Tax=Alkalibacter rhizosphaerae TaxID=2815577 RepID=UPI001FEE8C6F|nr:PAS domain-containing protein [Alkalibacter rhizosphaerae]
MNVVDNEFRFARNNLAHQRLTGLKDEIIRGRTLCELLGADLGTTIAENYTRCMETGRTIEYKETLCFFGQELTFLTSLTPEIENGTVRKIVG